METAKISLWEVIIGIWILAIVVILGGIFFVPEPLPYALGEIAGSITASGLMVHLYRSIDIELDLPEKKAVSHSRAMGLVRSAIEIGVLVGSFFLSKWVMPYTVLAGLLASCLFYTSTYNSTKKDAGVRYVKGKNRTNKESSYGNLFCRGCFFECVVQVYVTVRKTISQDT